jgi:hypothetical protein
VLTFELHQIKSLYLTFCVLRRTRTAGCSEKRHDDPLKNSLCMCLHLSPSRPEPKGGILAATVRGI